MSTSLDPLIRDFVAWVAREPRPYAEALEAWRTSCPRLTVWEEATERGLVQCERAPGGGLIVVATDLGRRLLDRSGPSDAINAINDATSARSGSSA